MPEPDAPRHDTADALPRHTTPTWEMELLISGAAVFAMLQFPGWLSTHIMPLLPRFGINTVVALSLLYAYLASAAVILAATFAVHLGLRARWIALIGMHSVFPDGVRWKGLRIGPQERDIARQHDPGPVAVIERADNGATIVFAFGVMLATTLLVLCLAVIVSFGITWLVNLAGFRDINIFYVLITLVVLALVPISLTKLVDRRYGHRARPGGIAQRAIARIYAIYRRFGAVRGFSIARVLESRVGSRRFGWLTALVMTPVVLGVIASLNAWQAPMQFGSYAGFPRLTATNPNRISAAHYDDERDPVHDPAVAYIQSEVVTGPYVELTIPYTPIRDGAALRDDCPAVHATRDKAARAAVTLDCLTSWHAVSLDGKALTGLHYDVASDPRTQRPALQAMIDVRALAPGRHALRVERAPIPTSFLVHSEGDKAKAWTITFWR